MQGMREDNCALSYFEEMLPYVLPHKRTVCYFSIAEYWASYKNIFVVLL